MTLLPIAALTLGLAGCSQATTAEQTEEEACVHVIEGKDASASVDGEIAELLETSDPDSPVRDVLDLQFEPIFVASEKITESEIGGQMDTVVEHIETALQHFDGVSIAESQDLATEEPERAEAFVNDLNQAALAFEAVIEQCETE